MAVSQYETGAEVFAADTHEQAHFPRIDPSPMKSSMRGPLNVILGEVPGVKTHRKIRPQSAKK